MMITVKQQHFVEPEGSSQHSQEPATCTALYSDNKIRKCGKNGYKLIDVPQ
jgi:hypothetical protein